MKVPASVQRLQRLRGQRPKLQWRLMKWPICAALALALGSCTYDPGYPGPASPGWSGTESSAYRAGHSDGSKDKRQGRRYNTYPRQNQFPPATRDDYVKGYMDGFRNANDNPWSKRRAHELGHNHGRQDKLAGRPMNPSRHAGEVPGTVRDDFNRGYREGWNATGIVRPGRPPGTTPY
jgi:hypothetical protein